jgi:hypothetical protein
VALSFVALLQFQYYGWCSAGFSAENSIVVSNDCNFAFGKPYAMIVDLLTLGQLAIS